MRAVKSLLGFLLPVFVIFGRSLFCLPYAEVAAIERDQEYEDPMANIIYPDVDRLTFWGVPYQFDYVFGPGTEQAQVRPICIQYLTLNMMLFLKPL